MKYQYADIKKYSYGDKYSMKEFIEDCEDTYLIDDDGSANPIIGDKIVTNLHIYPSDILKGKYRHFKEVMWFNR